VGISDSTTSPHSGDSRHVGEDKSEYNGNRYHAWAKVDKDGHTGVERCENGEYHRSCDKNGSTAIERAIINTKHDHTPTGIGAGKMYVNDDMKGYRSKYSADTVDEGVEVFVGRPIKCS
jgi:hypothetical protein